MDEQKNIISRAIDFVTVGIWENYEEHLGKGKTILYNTLRVIILTARGFIRENLSMKASGLTYSTLLAVVPILALMLAIGRGFGLQDMIEEVLIKNIPGQSDALQMAFQYVNAYLEYTRGGVFVGIGLIILLFSVISLLLSIESTFNEIWQIEKSRSLDRQLINFLAIMIMIPVLLIVSGGLSFFVSATFSNNFLVGLFSPVVKILMKLLPYIVNSLIFTVLYLLIPNTKVKFLSALLAGIFAGVMFQIFQLLYIHGQIWVTTYNAIYGSFAALPLLLMWLQLSFMIFLTGSELAFAIQNYKSYEGEAEIKNITRRYTDFLCVVVLSIIIKRFEEGEPPVSAQEISEDNNIPTRLTNQLLTKLEDVNMITQCSNMSQGGTFGYMPAFDINKMTVGLLFERLEHTGSENFRIDKRQKYQKTWQLISDIKQRYVEENKDVLIKDL